MVYIHIIHGSACPMGRSNPPDNGPSMTPPALALVLMAAICHAVWNLVAKRAGGGSHFVLMGALLVAVVWMPAALWVGMDAAWHWGGVEWTILATSALLHVLYFRTLLHGYAVSDLTVVYPVARGSAPLLSSASAVAALAFG